MTQAAIKRALMGDRGSLDLIELPSKTSPSVSRKPPKGAQVSPLLDRVRFLDDEDVLAIVDSDFSKVFSSKENRPNHRRDFVDNLPDFIKVLKKKANQESGLSVSFHGLSNREGGRSVGRVKIGEDLIKISDLSLVAHRMKYGYLRIYACSVGKDLSKISESGLDDEVVADFPPDFPVIVNAGKFLILTNRSASSIEKDSINILQNLPGSKQNIKRAVAAFITSICDSAETASFLYNGKVFKSSAPKPSSPGGLSDDAIREHLIGTVERFLQFCQTEVFQEGHPIDRARIIDKINHEIDIKQYRQDAFLTEINRNKIKYIPFYLETEEIDINKANERDGLTPLFLAIYEGDLGVISLLLKKSGLDVNKENKNSGHTPLTLAINKGRADIVDLLLKRGDLDIHKANTKSETTPLGLAKGWGNKEIVKKLQRYLKAEEVVTKNIILPFRRLSGEGKFTIITKDSKESVSAMSQKSYRHLITDYGIDLVEKMSLLKKSDIEDFVQGKGIGVVTRKKSKGLAKIIEVNQEIVNQNLDGLFFCAIAKDFINSGPDKKLMDDKAVVKLLADCLVEHVGKGNSREVLAIKLSESKKTFLDSSNSWMVNGKIIKNKLMTSITYLFPVAKEVRGAAAAGSSVDGDVHCFRGPDPSPVGAGVSVGGGSGVRAASSVVVNVRGSEKVLPSGMGVII